jgi:hypothetical protein
VQHGEQREELVELLHAKKGMLRIEGNAAEIAVQIDGQSVGAYMSGQALDVELSQGPHEMVAKSDGRKKLVATIDVAGGQIQPLDLVMMPKTPRGAAWTQAVLSAAFIGGGVALGTQSNRIYDDLDRDRRAGILASDDDRYNKGKLYAIGATGCYSVGGVLAILSAYNFIKDPTPESAVKPGKSVDLPDTDDTAEASVSHPRALYRPTQVPVLPPAPMQDITLVPMRAAGSAGFILQGSF